jgi:hypothetical protein
MLGSTFLAAVTVDPSLALWVALATLFFVGALLLFALNPSVAVALTIPFFAVLATLKALVASELGPAKDIVVLAAVCAAVLAYRVDRRRPDGWLVAAVGAELALYVLNLRGEHDVAWAHGVRLMGEPLVLLLVGLTLRDAARTLRLAVYSLVATSCVVAAYGVLQQAIGPATLVDWGYVYGREVRTIGGHLRSFGTFDEPFAFAAFLLFGLVAVTFCLRRRPLTYVCTGLILAGLAASLVRTSALTGGAVVGLWLVSRSHARVAAVALAAVAAATVLVVMRQPADESHPVGGVDAVLTLNGRASEWKATVGQASDWPLGRGVGETGTAAERATYTLDPGSPDPTRPDAGVADNGYLATVADVGLVGLAVLLFMFARLVYLARASLPSRAAWLGLGLLTVLLIDALARSSFTAFPIAWLGLLLVGVAIAAANDESRHAAASTPI